MICGFYTDSANSKCAERLVLDYLQAQMPSFTFEDVSAIPDYYYKGDIKATSPYGDTLFIEVKKDSRIGATGNVLCEEKVRFHMGDYFTNGNMQGACDVYAIVSYETNTIYFLDFKILKSIYKEGRYREIEHPEQTTYCYLLPLAKLNACGGIIETATF